MVECVDLRTVVWESKENKSIEYFSLYQTSIGYLFKGSVIVYATLPILINYQVECDKTWLTKSAHVTQESNGKTSNLTLRKAGQDWLSNESPILSLAGLFDVDLEFSPATNTLPLRRLNLKVGESSTVESVWVRHDGLRLEKLRQKYSRLDDTHYKYEYPSSDYTATLEVDDLGLIVSYGDLFKRIKQA